MVLHLGGDADVCLAAPHPAGNEGSPLFHVNRVGLHQPNVPVNARSLVKPTVTGGGVHAHQQHVSSARSGERSHIKAERIVTAAVPSDIEAIEDHHRFAV